VEMSASASKVMKTTKNPEGSREQQRRSKGNKKAGSKGSGKRDQNFLRFDKEFLDAIDQESEIPHDVLLKLFGEENTKVIETQNAHLNAKFDLDCSQCKPVLWPELPLRL